MRNAIILHGQPDKQEYYDPLMPSMSNAHWLPWLQAQLLKYDIAAVTPEVPLAYEPAWDLWKTEVERFEITSQTMLIGHSRGGEFWLRWLSEHPEVQVGKVVLVAPYIGYLTEEDPYFGHHTIDPELIIRTRGLTLFCSDNDAQEMLDSAKEIRTILPEVDYREFQLGHFTTSSMGKTEFPELLEEVLS